MSRITKQDTNGVKPLLQTGELGYDNYPAGGDAGRVWVGTGTENIALAKKTEVLAVDGKADTHIARVDNPHNVTKAQVGLANVDNTADSNKSVLSATKWTTARTISLTGDVTGNVSFDGSANVSITATVADDSHNHVISNVDGLQDALGSKANQSTTYTKTEVNNALDLKAPLESPTFTGTPKIGTDNITSISTAVTDNAIARYDGTTGKLQNSGVIIDDAGNVGVGVTPLSKLHVNGIVGIYGGNGSIPNIFAGLGIDAIPGGNTSIYNWLDNSSIDLWAGIAQKTGIHINGQTASGGSYVGIRTGGYETVKIEANGNLLVGTTVDTGVDKLQVKGSIKATELNVSANYITKVSKNVPGLSGSDYKDKYFILFKAPTWRASDTNYSVKGSLIAERVNNGVTVYTDFSVGCGYNNGIYKTYLQDKGNVGTSLVYVTINSIQYVAIYWYSAPNQHDAWFDGFITNFNASSVIDNLCGTIFETAQNELSRIII